MSDAAITALIGAAGAVLTAIGAFARWALQLWAQVRREGIVAAQAESAHQREDNDRMINALLEQARSNTQLAGKLELVASKLDTLFAHAGVPNGNRPTTTGQKDTAQ
jgi:hypothetical protein